MNSKKVRTKLQCLNKNIYNATADQTSVINFFPNVFMTFLQYYLQVCRNISHSFAQLYYSHQSFFGLKIKLFPYVVLQHFRMSLPELNLHGLSKSVMYIGTTINNVIRMQKWMCTGTTDMAVRVYCWTGKKQQLRVLFLFPHTRMM